MKAVLLMMENNETVTCYKWFCGLQEVISTKGFYTKKAHYKSSNFAKVKVFYAFEKGFQINWTTVQIIKETFVFILYQENTL